MLNKTNWEQEIIDNAKKFQKENEEIINSLVQKLKSINSFGIYIQKQDICLYMENFIVEENEYNAFIIGQAYENDKYKDNSTFGISKIGLMNWNDDFEDIELEYVDGVIVLEL